jgi:hypothetical protein
MFQEQALLFPLLSTSLQVANFNLELTFLQLIFSGTRVGPI